MTAAEMRGVLLQGGRHLPQDCPCRKKHKAICKSRAPGEEIPPSDVCGECGSSLLIPGLAPGCSRCVSDDAAYLLARAEAMVS